MQDLRVAVDDLQTEARAVHLALARHTQTTRQLAVAITAVLVVFAASGLAWAWELHRQIGDQRVLCPVILLQIPTETSGAPATERDRLQVETYRALARKLHC